MKVGLFDMWIDTCPYCEAEAGGVLVGIDDAIDYCHECEVVIEGETVRVCTE